MGVMDVTLQGQMDSASQEGLLFVFRDSLRMDLRRNNLAALT